MRLPNRTAQAASAADAAEDIGTIEVTGYRLSLRNAIDIKKNASVMMDAINAEDIADFPDANLAESLQRLPGVALDRDNGEGRSITVRGLGSDFTRVRLNGLETLSTAAASDSGTSPNRGRGFDFNVFASDLFSSLEVTKTASASADEGSLGATVDLVTGKPLDYKGTQARAVGGRRVLRKRRHAQPAHRRIGCRPVVRRHARRVGFGCLQRTHLRGGSLQASGRPVRLRISRFDLCGHAADTACRLRRSRGHLVGRHDRDERRAESRGDRRADRIGSRRLRALYPGAPYSTPGRFNDSLVRIPSLMNIEQQDLEQERLGLTGAVQWKPTEAPTSASTWCIRSSIRRAT